MRRAAVPIVIAGLFLLLFFPNYMVQWIGFVTVFLVVVAWGYTRIVDMGLVIERDTDRLRAYKHQIVTVRLRIRNRSVLPIPHLMVTDNPGSLYTGHQNHRLLSMRAGERSDLVYDIKAMNRGAYRIGPVNIRFSDPFGFFPMSRIIETEARLIVYPRVYPVSIAFHHGVPTGSITAASRIYEDPTRYRAIREYVPGDELRRVNWKASARLGTLHSTEWLPTINTPVLILLELGAHDYEQRNRYAHSERTIDAAASLVQHLAERKQEVGFITTGRIRGAVDGVLPTVRVGSGIAHAVAILELLAELELNQDRVSVVDRLLERGRLSPGTRVFYMGPALAEDALSRLLMAVRNRSLLRLYYTAQGVLEAVTSRPDTVRRFTITESGDELFTL